MKPRFLGEVIEIESVSVLPFKLMVVSGDISIKVLQLDSEFLRSRSINGFKNGLRSIDP